MRTLTTLSLCLFVLAVSLAQSLRKRLWYDEIFTARIARTERVDGIWSALATGTDLNPPLSYLAVRCADGVLGPTLQALRLPSVLGYLLMSVCLYRFVSRWYPAPFAWLAMLFPLITEAFWYASEARPYGLVLGFSALAMVCWQDATAGVRRPLALVGLGLSLAAAVSSHYYAVLTVVPLAAGEFVRTWTRKRLDFGIWFALLLAPLSLLSYLPLLAECRKYAATFWAKPAWWNVPHFYEFLFPRSAPALIAMFFLSVLGDRTRRPATVEESPDGGRAGGPPLHDLVAAATFAAMPALAVALATIGKAGFTDRYAITAVIGLGVLVSVAAHRAVRGRTAPALGMIAVLLAVCLLEQRGAIKAMLTRAPAPGSPISPALEGRVILNDDDLAVAVPHPHLYLESTESLPAASASRLVFLSEADDTGTLGLRSLARLKPLKIEEYASFRAAHKRFLVLDFKDDGLSAWLISRLVQDGAKVTIRSQEGRLRVYEVQAGG